ncbi:aspartate aminotransferase family protein, partial [Streptomyces sp. PRKS01-65]|nr:aspartate aminotransferase family protein [Streptomyces harenosi]
MSTPHLASGPDGPDALRPLLDTVLDALRAGTRARGGPLPAGGPGAVARQVRDAAGDILPETGDPGALRTLVTVLAAGAADLAASVLNPSLDSWDQAPAASELEALVTGALAREAGAADALVTTGGTDSNHLAVLLAREARGGGLQVIHGANAHHSLPRAAWLLGLPEPVVVPAPSGTLDP